MLSNLLSALEKPLFKPLNKVTGTTREPRDAIRALRFFYFVCVHAPYIRSEHQFFDFDSYAVSRFSPALSALAALLNMALNLVVMILSAILFIWLGIKIIKHIDRPHKSG